MRPDGQEFTVVFEFELGLVPIEIIPWRAFENCWDLWMFPRAGSSLTDWALVVGAFARDAASNEYVDHVMAEEGLPFMQYGRQFWETAILDRVAPPIWNVTTSWNLARTLRAENLYTGEKRVIAFETPMFPEAFHATYATALPGDLVVFQMGSEYSQGGHDVILVADLRRRIVGILAEGYSPIVTRGVGESP